MNCDICEKPIGTDRLAQATKVSIWDVSKKTRVEYHRPCWNLKVSEQIKKEDESLNQNSASRQCDKCNAMSNWINIDILTPEDDTRVIGCRDDDVYECLHLTEGYFDCNTQPTHWQPLPEPLQ